MKRSPLALIWAAGEARDPGSRSIPLHQRLLGKSILRLAIEAVQGIRPREILVHIGDDAPKEAAPPSGVRFLSGQGVRGALGAVLSAGDALARNRRNDLVLVDARLALLSRRSLRSLLSAHRRSGNAVTTAEGLDMLSAQVFRIGDLLDALDRLGPRQRRGGKIDAVIKRIAGNGGRAGICRLSRPEESLAVRSPAGVSTAIMFLRERKIAELESRGVIILDPAATWVDLDVRIGPGTVLYPAVVIEGNTRIGARCRIYPFVHLIDAQIGEGAKILSSTVVEKSRIGREAQVGPFARFRPMNVVRPKAKVGNFVEMKNTVFGRRSKAGHLSYLGDSTVGEDVNIGAGTITCNYDGFSKSRTRIDRGAFIGSGTELIAPVRVGRGAYVGAGSVITKDVPAEALAVARGRQIIRPGWVRKRPKR